MVDQEDSPGWNSRGHFFAAAAKAMRRILVENARRRQSSKAGGYMARVPLDEREVAEADEDQKRITLQEALAELQAEQPIICQLVELRYFAGLTIDQAATAKAISPRTANRYGTYTKAWLNKTIC